MKNILIVCALPLETNILKEKIKNTKDLKFSFLSTWVWNFNMIYSLKEYLETKTKPDFIVNIWVCWKLNNDFNNYFSVVKIKNSSNSKEALVPIFLPNLELKSILCSDKIVTSKDDLNWFEFVDMESFWFDFVLSKQKIPYLILKKPFDEVWIKSTNLDLSQIKHLLLDFDFEKLFAEITKYLDKNSAIFSEVEILKFKHKFGFTFAETELFKKYLNKNIAFWLSKNDMISNLKKINSEEIQKKIKQ